MSVILILGECAVVRIAMHGVNNANKSVLTIFHTTTSSLFSSFSRLSQSFFLSFVSISSLSLFCLISARLSHSRHFSSRTLHSLCRLNLVSISVTLVSISSLAFCSRHVLVSISPLCLVLSCSCLYLRSFSLFLILLALVVSCSAWLPCLVSSRSSRSLLSHLVSSRSRLNLLSFSLVLTLSCLNLLFSLLSC